MLQSIVAPNVTLLPLKIFQLLQLIIKTMEISGEKKNNSSIQSCGKITDHHRRNGKKITKPPIQSCFHLSFVFTINRIKRKSGKKQGKPALIHHVNPSPSMHTLHSHDIIQVVNDTKLSPFSTSVYSCEQKIKPGKAYEREAIHFCII